MPVSQQSSEKDSYPVPPPDLRCRRTDGRYWRCNRWRIHEQRYCEEHYLQIVVKCEKMRSLSPVSPPRVLGKDTESSKSSGRKGGGLAVGVGKPKMVGLSSGGRRDKGGSRGRSKASSSEEVLPVKTLRGTICTVEEDNDEEEKLEKKSDEKVTKRGRRGSGERDKEEGRSNVVKSGKRAGKDESLKKKKKGAERDEEQERDNFAKSDGRGGKDASLMKKKKELERKGDSDEEVGTLRKRAERSSKIKMLPHEKKKVLKDEGTDDHEEGDNDLKISRTGGKIGVERKKKETEVNEESEEEVDHSSGKLGKRRGGVKCANKKNKAVQNDQSEEEEDERHNVVDSEKMKGKIDVGKQKNADRSEMSDEEEEEEERSKVGNCGERYSELERRWKEKKVESSEETEEEEVERGRELTRAENSGRLKWENDKMEVLRSNQSVGDGDTPDTVRGDGSGSVEQGKRKRSGGEASSDEEEVGRANVEIIDKKGSTHKLGKKKEKLERDQVRNAVTSDEPVIAMKRQEIRSNESGCDSCEKNSVAESVEKDDEIGFGKSNKTLLETEGCDKEEKVIKGLLGELENFGNGDTDDTAQDGNINDAKKKYQLRGESKEIDEGKADRDWEDGGEGNCQPMQKSKEVRKEEIEGYDGYHADGVGEMENDCSLTAKMDLEPEACLKSEDKKLMEEKGRLPKMLKFVEEERSGQEGTIGGENMGSFIGATKKTMKEESTSGQKRRKGLKRNNTGETKEEVDNSDECVRAVHSGRGKSSSSKDSGLKVDRRRKHFSTDDPEDDCQMCHQCMRSNGRVVRCRKEREERKEGEEGGSKNYNGRRYCESCIKEW